jgi:prepilin-type N-terminal cleavage/methylation domain-containing protein
VLKQRRGFTLAEALIALAIIATMAAVLGPSMVSQLRRGQSTATANALANLRDALVAYRGNVADYPRTLSLLTNAPIAGATDACGNVISAAQRNAWRGPYLTQNISGSMVIGDGTALDTLIRTPATDAATAPGILTIRIINVDSTVAVEIDRQFDSTVDLTAGVTTWTTNGLDTLKFNISIRNC